MDTGAKTIRQLRIRKDKRWKDSSNTELALLSFLKKRFSTDDCAPADRKPQKPLFVFLHHNKCQLRDTDHEHEKTSKANAERVTANLVSQHNTRIKCTEEWNLIKEWFEVSQNDSDWDTRSDPQFQKELQPFTKETHA